ncbi:8876_t:CDS:2, partial [Scutellospora calospora]
MPGIPFTMSSNEFSQNSRFSIRIQNQRSETSVSGEIEEEKNSVKVSCENTYLSQIKSSNGLFADWKYDLEIVQQPVRARACGYGNKDFRSISPPICIKLNISTSSGPVNIDLYDRSFENCTTVWVKSSNPQVPKEKIINLIGSRSETCSIFADEHGKKGLWFIYANLGVRTVNDYFLRFQLFYLGWESVLNVGAGPIKELATIDSAEFKVFRNKQFPRVCSQLTKCLAKQGANIPLRNETAKVKNTSHSVEDEIVNNNNGTASNVNNLTNSPNIEEESGYDK